VAIEPHSTLGSDDGANRRRSGLAYAIKSPAILGKCHSNDEALVRIAENLFACRNVENDYCILFAAGGKPSTVWAEGNCEDPAVVPQV